MVNYFITGDLSHSEFVICERLLDLMVLALPDIQVFKSPKTSDEWPDEKKELCRLYGFQVPYYGTKCTCNVLVWIDTMRLISSDSDTLSIYVLKKFGITLDLSPSDILLYVQRNVQKYRNK